MVLQDVQAHQVVVSVRLLKKKYNILINIEILQVGVELCIKFKYGKRKHKFMVDNIPNDVFFKCLLIN